MNIKQIMLFAMVLLVGLTVVSAADIIDADATDVTVETPQVDQTNNIQEIAQENVQEDNIEEEDLDPCSQTPREINSNLVIDDNNYACYNNVNWTVGSGVTIDGANYQFTNVAINVVGNYVNLENLKITTSNATKLIDATGTKNLTITDSTLTLTNFRTSSNNQAIGIDLTNAANASITGTNLQVNAPSQGQTWDQDENENWYSTLKVSGILVNNAANITIDQNTIRILNTTEKYAYTTMPAITIKNGTSNINVTFNTIYATGAHFVYGIMMNDGVSNAALKNNTITVNDKLYVAGIDASTASNSIVSGNHITATSTGQTTYDSIVGEESLAYGIISDTYATGNQNNRICKNIIIATANTVYGIEVYKGDNITVCSNNIYGTGNKTMGVAFAHTTDSKIINNFMRLTGSTVAHHPFYEEVTPVNAGIIFTNQSNGNLIQGNDIEITAIDDDAAYAINLQNSTTATVTGNRLYANYDDVNPYEDNSAVITDALCSSISILTNYGVVLYNCDCGCINTNNQNTLENQFFYKTSVLKKDTNAGETIIISDDNTAQYGITGNSINGDIFNPGTNIILNLTGNVKIYNCTNINLIADISPVTSASNPVHLVSLSSFHTLDTFVPNIREKGFNLSNFYGPNTQITLQNSNVNITNSTFARISMNGAQINHNITLENNTIISPKVCVLSVSKSGIAENITLRNNYMVLLNSTTLETGAFFNPTNGRDYIVNLIEENNTPNYENPLILNNSNYDTYFDEENTIKSDYTDKVLFATENITKPVNINTPITLSALRNYGGYNTITFLEGSDNSIIEDSIINKVTINSASYIKVNNNKLLSDDSVIEVINSVENIIENNTINTKNTNTITFDADSFGTTVKHNELIANELTGDSSVLTTGENTVEDNTPISEEPILTPELKVDTTEFTIGTTSNIKASIYLGDEVASNLNGGKVVFKVNGVTLKDQNGKVIYAKVVDGAATIENYEIPKTWNKEEITITAVYSGSKDCEALRSEETELTITPEQSNPTINTEQTPTNATIGQTIQLKAKITDQNNPITTGKVVFKVNGKTVKDANGKVIYANVDTNGEVTVNYTIPDTMKAKDYNITITFTSAKYETITTNTTITITKT